MEKYSELRGIFAISLFEMWTPLDVTQRLTPLLPPLTRLPRDASKQGHYKLNVSMATRWYKMLVF